MSGDSYTQLNPGAVGDKIYDEDVGGGVKMPASKIHTGALGADGGAVTTTNPFPVGGAVLSGSYPDPSSQATGTSGAIGIDAFGNVMVRGPIITDEESLADDFSGA